MGYGIKIKQYRLRAGYSLDEAAKAIDVTPVTMSRYENDSAPIPVSVFIKLARLYDFDVFDIMHVRRDGPVTDEEFTSLISAHCSYIVGKEREQNISFGTVMPEDYYERRYRELFDAEKDSLPPTDQLRRRSK